VTLSSLQHLITSNNQKLIKIVSIVHCPLSEIHMMVMMGDVENVKLNFRDGYQFLLAIISVQGFGV
jgi:hypothetical protein